MTLISKYYHLEEFTYSKRAEGMRSMGIEVSNTPDKVQLKNLKALATKCIDPICEKWGHVTVSSGFRSQVINASVGGAPGSQHLYGQAADIVSKTLTAEQLFVNIATSKIVFDQLIFEKDTKGKTWVHISYVEGANRRQILVIKPKGNCVVWKPGMDLNPKKVAA